MMPTLNRERLNEIRALAERCRKEGVGAWDMEDAQACVDDLLAHIDALEKHINERSEGSLDHRQAFLASREAKAKL